MIKQTLNIGLLLLSLQMQAQYTYFNQIEGEVGDLASEQMTNIEVVEDGYVTWGGGINNGEDFEYLRKYDLNGVLVDENIIDFDNESFYAGIGNSMQWNPHTEQFVVLQGSIIDGGVSARLLTFDPNLELNQNIIYDTYAPNTYFFGFLIEEDGYVIYGEHGPLINGEGTFVMKLDFDGNVLWNEIMQPEVNEHVYRNWSLVPLETGYLISGGGNTGDPFGLITIVDEVGNTESVITVEDEDGLQSYPVGSLQLSNGEILMTQAIAFDDIAEIENPNFYFRKTRVSKFNPETEEFYWQQDYFEEMEMILGGPGKRVEAQDGGVVILGGRYGWFFDYYMWMLKIDADGNQEWFQEYTYETCDNCWNLLYDIELAPDGGFVAAGYFQNFEEDPRNNPWLLKVDACGDVEWQGCEPLSLFEKEQQSFSIHPNPSTGRFTVRTAAIEQRPSSGVEMSRYEMQKRVVGYEVVDRTGRVLDSARTPTHQLTTDGLEINIDAPTGLYLLRLQLDDGTVESYRVEIVR